MITLVNDDCLNALPNLNPQSVHLAVLDLPYGILQGKATWDTPIALEPLWIALQAVLTPTGVLAAFCNLRLACDLTATCPKGWFRYDLVWNKVNISGFLDANRRPLRQHELILIFSPVGYPTYNPQYTEGKPYTVKRSGTPNVYGSSHRTTTENIGTRYPTSILKVPNGGSSKSKHHHTCKPDAIYDWLIKTYSNSSDTVLDPCFGSGGSGISAITNNRNYIGIEKDPIYFANGKSRIGAALPVEVEIQSD